MVVSRTLKSYFWFLLLALIFSGLIQPALAQTPDLPENFTVATWVDGLSRPTAMAFAPDGRLFVTEQSGTLRVIKDGALLDTPFLSLTVDDTNERGLLGVAFDPGFTTNHYVYVYYTVPGSPAHNRVSRFTANEDVAQGGETILFDIDDLSTATNHNGGALHFGPDGKLYIAVGDAATSTNAQDRSNLFGSILRINADGSIPADNPFYAELTDKNRAIWAYGLRNPFTFAFQPDTSLMYINDVGQNTWEEINEGAAGGNYGWPTTEGETNNPDFISPLYTYSHSEAGVCAIAGGGFYNPPTDQFPETYVGDYFFADYCAGWIQSYDIATDTVHDFATNIEGGIVDIKIGSDGTLYYLSRNSHAVHQITYSSSAPPTITQHPEDVVVVEGESATFTCSASGTPPLSYQWQRNSVNVNDATSSAYTFSPVGLADSGSQFRCVVSNDFGTVTSNPATLTVTENERPTAEIILPAANSRYNAGQVINFKGMGIDPEDGTLPAESLTWQVDFHHDQHTHPFLAPFSGQTEGSFQIPTFGHTEHNVWYRIYLTVTDSAGLASTTYVEIYPNKVTLTLETHPQGLQIDLNGQPQTTPTAFLSVIGVEHSLSVPSPQTQGDNTYVFQSWSDGGSREHGISTPGANSTYTATFAQVVFATTGFGSAPEPDAMIAVGWGPIDSTRSTVLNVFSNNDFDLNVSASSISGEEAENFSISNGPPFVLAAGSDSIQSILIECRISQPGWQTANLTLTTNDPTQPEVSYTLRCFGVDSGNQTTPITDDQAVSGNLNAGLVLPTFLWQPQHAVGQTNVWYHIIIKTPDGDTLLDLWRAVDSVCSPVICAFTSGIDELPGGLLNGDYEWSLQWWSEESGFSSLIGPNPFDVEVPLGTGPLPQNDGLVQRPWVEIGLQPDSSAAWYHVWIGTPDFQAVYFDWLPKPDRCNGALTCTLRPPAYPLSGNYIWYIQSWGAAGFNNNDPNSWKGPFDLNVSFDAPGRVQDLTATATGDGTATFTWAWDEAASWYNIWVGSPAPDFEQAYSEWHWAVDLGCANDDICTLTPDGTFDSGEYAWYVQAWGPGGFSTDGDFEPPLQSWVKADDLTVP